MPRMMKAAVVHTFGKKLTLDDVPVPTPGAGEVLYTLSRPACAIPICMLPMVTGR